MNRGRLGKRPEWIVSYSAASVVPQAVNDALPMSQGAVMAAACGAPIPTFFTPAAYAPSMPSPVAVIVAAAG